MSRGPPGGDSHRPPDGGGARPQVLAGARLTHERAAVEQLEAASHGDVGARLDALLAREGVSEAAVLQTCNRVEEYVVAETATRGRAALEDFAATAPDGTVEAMGHGESLRHLLRVAAGLDSQVLGEDQILGQVRRTFADAKRADAIGPVLEDAFLKAIHVGERARTETAINEGVVSLGSAAVAVADREGDLSGRVVVVGAGDVAETVLAALDGRDVGSLHVLNRTAERAAALAEAHGAGWAGLDDLPAHLAAADVVLASTGGSSPLLGRAALAEAGETLVVDLGQPRDVAPDARELEDVTVYDLDDLRVVTRHTHEERREAAAAVEAIVDEEYDRLVESYKRQRADAVVRGMYRGAERIKERELERALGRLDGLDAEDHEVVEDLADAIVSHILAVPTESLRDAAANDDLETLLAAIELFDPGLDPDRTRELLAELPEAFLDGGAPEGTAVGEGGED